MYPQGNSIVEKPLFDPTYLNIEYVFDQILSRINPFLAALSDRHTWDVIGLVSSLLSVAFIAIIIYALVRMREIQLHEEEEIDHEIHEALSKDAAKERSQNPRWHYIRTLVESPNESDWRVSIMEADSMLDELLEQKGYQGDSLGEKLEILRSGGLSTIQNAWDGHIVRNQIAHAGSDFSLTHVEARRVINLYQNVFEELGAI